jgi:hypothetical protein
MTESPSGPTFASERRDAERLTALWSKEASKYGGPPPITTFELLDTFRFVVCANTIIGHHSFHTYGAPFARLLGLPETPAIGAPLADQLPRRYLPLFIDGCDKALVQMKPIPYSDFIVYQEQIELYRAVFLPLADQPKSQTRLILGSFNCRIVPTDPTRSRGPFQSLQ